MDPIGLRATVAFQIDAQFSTRRFDRQEPLARKEVSLVPGVLSRILAEELAALFADLK